MPKKNEPESRALAVAEPPASAMGFLTPQTIDEALKLSETIAKAKLVPEALRGSAADCLLVINQAMRWNLDPLAVAQGISVVHGKLCYEGKLCHAVLQATGAIRGSLEYEYDNEDNPKKIVVSGVLADGNRRSITGTVAAWATKNEMWRNDPKKMLAYRGAREWGRMHAPAVMMGFNVADEVEVIHDAQDVEVADAKPARPSVVEYATEVEQEPDPDPIVKRQVVRQAKAEVVEEPDPPAVEKNDPLEVPTQSLKAEAIATSKDWWRELQAIPEIKADLGLATKLVTALCKAYGADKPPALTDEVCPDFLQSINDLRVLSDPKDIEDAIVEIARERGVA